MKFSVCIPNYNYAQYISETITSVLKQNVEIEVIVSDNCSTDNSVTKVKELHDARVHVRENSCNIGFAGNLDQACRGAIGERMILLSSDDLASPNSLSVYGRLAEALGPNAKKSIFASDQHIIDSKSRIMGASGRDSRMWKDATYHEELSNNLGYKVLHIPAKILLKSALEHLRTPFAFATTCYPRSLYKAVEGYGASALMNPDKAFAWKILSVAEDVYYVEAPLFSYRVHGSNQNAQQRQSGALKHMMDQYRATFDTSPSVLKAAGLSYSNLASAFVEHDVALRGLKAVAENERFLARRHLDFGRAAYPSLINRSQRMWILRASLALGPIGTWIAKRRLNATLKAYRDGGLIKPDKEHLPHG